MTAKEWRREMRGKTKRLYNLLEKRHVLTMRQTFPDRIFVEQVRIVGIKSSRGSIKKIPSGNGKGRIADWAAIDTQSSTVQLGDIKSSWAIIRSVKGGIKQTDEIEGLFRSTSTIAKQQRKELEIIQRAQRVDGEILLRGRDPSTEEMIEWAVPHNRLLPSRISAYMEVGSN
jgi:hypothetical protein